jgi:ABC-type sugar transport system substrate-binding protein/AraC-like DNA-binding protein
LGTSFGINPFFLYFCKQIKEQNMRKTIVHTLLYIAAVVMLFASCAEKETYRIGVSQCAEGRWREKVNNEMLAAQHLYEQDVKVTIASAHDDTQLQVRQIDSLVSTGIDLLVVAPNEAAPIAAAIERVRKKGIPVICFDRKVKGDNYTAFIGGSNVEAGHAIGVNVVDVANGIVALKHRPLVLEVTALMSSSPAQERHEGFAKALEGHNELDYVCREGDWSSETTCRIVKEQIESGRLPDIVFCHNDGMATGAYKALVETGTEGKIYIYGIDGMPDEGLDYVQFGHQLASYVYPTGGGEIIRLALNILTGKPYERENKLDGILVVRENVWSISTTTKELMRQNENLVTIQDKLEDYLGLYNTQHKAFMASIVLIVLLTVAVIAIWRAYVLSQRAIKKRQALNEEETLFYTNPDSRKVRKLFKTPTEELPAPKSQNTIFAESLNEAIRKNMSNPSLKMEDLGETVGLSRVQLYRKVKTITGLSPVELLRQMRLQQGYVLLSTTNKTVQEIAHEVGFATPGYFSKCFREQYGKYPMELRNSTNVT